MQHHSCGDSVELGIVSLFPHLQKSRSPLEDNSALDKSNNNDDDYIGYTTEDPTPDGIYMYYDCAGRVSVLRVTLVRFSRRHFITGPYVLISSSQVV